jgi:hypothetical protein
VNQDGALGGLVGIPVPMEDERPGDSKLVTAPMQPGQEYWVGTPTGAVVDIRVRAGETVHDLPEPEVWPLIGLTDELARRIRANTVEALVGLRDPGESPAETVHYATELADRIAEMAEGVVDDIVANRYFGPGDWRVGELLGEVDVREHVTVHTVETDDPDRGWVHTHGLVKFGRPEIEVWDVPREIAEPTAVTLLDIGQYTIGGALIEPGHTLGDPATPIRARISERDPEHWGSTPVLELVDVGEDGEPVESGAARGLRAWFESDPG